MAFRILSDKLPVEFCGLLGGLEGLLVAAEVGEAEGQVVQARGQVGEEAGRVILSQFSVYFG